MWYSVAQSTVGACPQSTILAAIGGSLCIVNCVTLFSPTLAVLSVPVWNQYWASMAWRLAVTLILKGFLLTGAMARKFCPLLGSCFFSPLTPFSRCEVHFHDNMTHITNWCDAVLLTAQCVCLVVAVHHTSSYWGLPCIVNCVTLFNPSLAVLSVSAWNQNWASMAWWLAVTLILMGFLFTELWQEYFAPCLVAFTLSSHAFLFFSFSPS